MPVRGFEAIRIVLFATLGAIVYGVLHDQVTAHLCVEYFTIAHPPVFPTDSPFLLALGWGVIATWWVGMSLGIALAAAARMGSRPKLGLADLRRPIVVLMAASAAAALLAGVCGALLAAEGIIRLPALWAALIPSDRQTTFIAVAWAHNASYVSAGLGGLLVIGLTIRKRRLPPRSEPDDVPLPSGRGAAIALELEQRYGLRLPEDFKAYMRDTVPESDWMNRHGITWWAPERIRSLAEECEGQLDDLWIGSEIEAEPDAYLVFADFLCWCYAYAICCSDGPDRGKVAIVDSGPLRFVADSFKRFATLAAEDSLCLHSPAVRPT